MGFKTKVLNNSCTLLGIYEYKFNTLTKNKKMKKILFKSEKFIIVVDSASKVVYGNVSRNAALEYLVNVTPKNAIDFARLQMLRILILSSKYVIAREIEVTTKVEVTVTADESSVVKTAEDALRVADKFGLKAEVQRELNNGATPLEALKKWDIQ